MAADDIQFHDERSRAERECARKAASLAAEQAHLALSELHAERARELGGDSGTVRSSRAAAPGEALAKVS